VLERELTGLRYSYEDAGPIIEDLDPFGWGATCRPLPVAELPDRQPPTGNFLPHQSVSDDLLTRHPGEPVCSLDRVVDVNLDQNNKRQPLRNQYP
jgi:hypothetical protein